MNKFFFISFLKIYFICFTSSMVTHLNKLNLIARSTQHIYRFKYDYRNYDNQTEKEKINFKFNFTIFLNKLDKIELESKEAESKYEKLFIYLFLSKKIDLVDIIKHRGVKIFI